MTQSDTPNAQQLPQSESPVIDLYEAISSIARKIEISEEWDKKISRCAFASLPECGFDPDNDRTHRFNAGLLANSLKASYCDWHAAATLHYHLKEVAEDGPTWRNWRSTGRAARLDPDEQKRAMSFLEYISQDCETRVHAYMVGKFDAGLKKPRNLPPLFNETDNLWVKCLGFERVDLIDLLDHAGVPHDLTPSQSDNKIGATQSDTTATNETRDRSVRASGVNRRRFRGPLAHVISEAVRRASDPEDYHSVWAAFVLIAAHEAKSFHPLTGYVPDEDVVKWDDGSDGQLYFKKTDMRKRIDPKAR